MLSMWMILSAIMLLCFSGLPACFGPSRSDLMQRVTAVVTAAASAIGVIGAGLAFCGTSPSLDTDWLLPWGRFSVSADQLSAFFLMPIFIVPALGSIYSLGYWKQSQHADNGRRLGFFYGLLAGSMAMVVISRDAILFLIAWEIMAMAAYFAATADDQNPEVRRAGWVYLIATHVGTPCLMAMFAAWKVATGTFALDAAHSIPAATAGTIFVLSLVGFGFKAGIMPLHVWLPAAHANAPSHVSAVMSGVMLKMGVYGIMRMTSLLPVTSPWWGGVTLAVGVVTGVVGIAFAVGQNDIKRLLAYSSIENIGIITIGLGLALLGKSQGRFEWVMLGMGGAILHVWNHSLFKSLLFFNAGAIIHAAETRNIDEMGGLAKHMPRTMMLFIVGAVAICALPPLNGFVSEWLIYVGLFETLGLTQQAGLPVAALALVALAMIGAIAVACFVKLLGAVFLGLPRNGEISHAHDPQPSMMLPMILLAGGCAMMGIVPVIVIRPLESAVGAWAGVTKPLVSAIAPLKWICFITLAAFAVAGVIALLVKLLPRVDSISRAGTWDCGYAKPSSRMEYTGTSFGQMVVTVFSFALWPKTTIPMLRGIFAKPSRFKIFVPDTILDRLVMPVFRFAGKYLPVIRIFQQGKTHLYLLYIMIIVIVLLICGTIGN